MKKTRNLKTVILSLTLTVFFSLSFISCNQTSSRFIVKVNGTFLENYTIVYEENNPYAQNCAYALSDLIFDVMAKELLVVSDKDSAETYYEILIGNTTRAQDDLPQNFLLKDNEYLLYRNKGKIIMQANHYMLGGSANRFVNDLILAEKKGNFSSVKISTTLIPYLYEFTDEPTNVILMIGDGMGQNHINLALERNAFSTFYASLMPVIGSVTTYSYSVTSGSASATDSAASATALATGYKTKNGYLGADHNKQSVKNVRELAANKGFKTAILTTDDITGATPSAFIVHSLKRDQTNEITAQINEQLAMGSLTVCQGNLGDELYSKTRKTLCEISSNNSGFFVMIEEAYIDKKSHSNSYSSMISAVSRYNDTILYAMQFALMHPNTALIVTADHETGGITFNNEYLYTTSGHTNENVPIFAMGKGANILSSTTQEPIDNIDIAKFIAKIYGEQNFGQTAV